MIISLLYLFKYYLNKLGVKVEVKVGVKVDK